MQAKKTALSLSPARLRKLQLQYLYARRSAITNLIASLQEYDRYRSRRLEAGRFKVA